MNQNKRREDDKTQKKKKKKNREKNVATRDVHGSVRLVLERFFAPHFWKVRTGLHKVQLILAAQCSSFGYMG